MENQKTERELFLLLEGGSPCPYGRNTRSTVPVHGEFLRCLNLMLLAILILLPECATAWSYSFI